MLSGRNIHYEGGGRMRGLGAGGIGAMQLLARRTGLTAAIDESLQLLKVHQPYHESDHVLNIAYNILCGGRTLEDLEQRRQDEVYLDALGARVIPDPTTAGDFCRRFTAADVETLLGAIDRVRVKVWQQQPAEFFAEAIIEADGTLAGTTGECKEGMGISYDGQWGYHPLVVTLANTGEPLRLGSGHFGLGHGSGAHAPDEYFVIESTNPKVAGWDGAVMSHVEYLHELATIS